MATEYKMFIQFSKKQFTEAFFEILFLCGKGGGGGGGKGHDIVVQSIYENYWHNLKQIATEFCSAGMHSGEVSLKHTKNPLRHLWGKWVKSAIKVTFSH